MNVMKVVLAVFSCIFFLVLFLLPDDQSTLLQAKYAAIPDSPMQMKFDDRLAKGQWMQTITLLDLFLDREIGNTSSEAEERQRILNRHLSDRSFSDRLNAYGWLDPGKKPLGKGSWSALKAKGVADFFLLNPDVISVPDGSPHKDLMTEIGHLALMKELWSESPEAARALQVAVSEDLLTSAMYKSFSRKFSLIRNPEKLEVAGVRQVLDTAMPVWQLLNHCGTWYEFQVLMRQVEDIQQVQFFLELCSSDPAALQKTVQILTLLEGDPTDSARFLEYLGRYRDNGLNRLFNMTAKGVAGIRFGIEHPNFVPAPVENDGFSAWCSDAMSWWRAQLLKSRGIAEFSRHLLLWLVGLGAVALFLPKNSLGPTAGVVGLFVLVIFVFNLFLRGNGIDENQSYKPGSTISSQDGQNTGVMNRTALQGQAGVRGHYRFGAESLLALLIIIGLQATACHRAVSEFRNVKGMRASYQGKLRQLENVDIFFDLPLYLGLLGTISSFVIMLFNPETSRIVAYSSTIVGIIISAVLRVFYLYPFRRELISHLDLNGKTVPEIES